jgi:hypothetical protein
MAMSFSEALETDNELEDFGIVLTAIRAAEVPIPDLSPKNPRSRPTEAAFRRLMKAYLAAKRDASNDMYNHLFDRSTGQAKIDD